MRLQGKVAIVTGAAQGIGRAIALAYAREGASVVVADMNADGARGVADEIAALGGPAGAAPFQIDVRDKDRAEAMVAAAVADFGGLDILVNNAGLLEIRPFFDTDEALWDKMFDVNCKGLLWCSQAAARRMVEQGRGGKIINLASQAGRRGEALVLAYCASKACVINMTQSMALALAPHKINVNAISPGVVDTAAWVKLDQQFADLLGMEPGEPKRTFTASIPLGRIEQPEDLTGMAIFLASAESDYITQQTYNVDGGNWPS
ncbi:MAG: Sorbitol dehydrogenase [uncultured Thermomicrobiales bacterium]|uniref:Sorbitol dehydrogenase n=1 Tax=uncultured Thermomicrobiales bacterium TaxID=1645740 RepID=A0A6J4UKZ2_9BACT|nr:MAG: Sorbitol dehydrogenase [uncultured Thermomicrobiales bacterium]